MGQIIGFCLIAILGVLLGLQFKGTKPEYSIYIGLALGFLVLGRVLNEVSGWIDGLHTLAGSLGTGGEYLGILMKVLGITYLCDYSASVCKDAGYLSLAGQVEILGKVAVVSAGMPVFQAVVDTLQTLLA